MSATGYALTGVSAKFRATHHDPVGLLEPHEHEWEVTAWFRTPHRADARCLRAGLETVLKMWDGTVLPPELTWGEDIARAVSILANCVEVEVRRPADGIHARWIVTE